MSLKRIRLPRSEFVHDERNEVIVNHAKIDRHVCVFNRCRRGKYEPLFLFIFTRFVRHPWPPRRPPLLQWETQRGWGRNYKILSGKYLRDKPREMSSPGSGSNCAAGGAVKRIQFADRRERTKDDRRTRRVRLRSSRRTTHDGVPPPSSSIVPTPNVHMACQ